MSKVARFLGEPSTAFGTTSRLLKDLSPARRDLFVKDFDDAVKQLVDLLRESDGTAEGKTKVFLFHGLHDNALGPLGASAVLRATARLLKSKNSDSDTRKYFGKIIHVDCTLWKNTRTIQRAIAEELNLHHVMPMIDKQDEDDDFGGVDDNYRDEIAFIGSVINESLRNERFVVFFHHGGDINIDLAECGIPLFGKGKLVWTNGRAFFHVNGKNVKLASVSASANIDIYMEILWDKDINLGMKLHHILHEEVAGVIGDTGMDGIFSPEVVLDCFLYSLFLTAQLPKNYTGVGYDWDTHACNYWICDGILEDDIPWENVNALYGVISWVGNSTDEIRHLATCLEQSKSWYSVTSNKLGADDISNVPASASSYFLTSQGDDPIYLRNGFFQLASNLRVLQLCNCSFNFLFPPFQGCHNLRFLWLDHCANTGNEQSGELIFPNLLVFDIRFTDYVLLPQMIEGMTNLRELNTKGVSWRTISGVCSKLQKIRKLRVTESSDAVRVDSCSSIDMMNLELLDFSGNTHMKSLPTLSSARSLKKVGLDGCSGLFYVRLALPLLENFSFDGYGPTGTWTKFDGYGPPDTWSHYIYLVGQPEKEMYGKSSSPVNKAKVTEISLDGCGRLQNIFLRGLPCLWRLDLSGTAIKILDLRAIDAPRLKELFLVGCEQLRSIIWGTTRHLAVLHIDTRRKTRSMVYCGELASFGFQACIAFIDGRFIRSVKEVLRKDGLFLSKVYILISSMSHSQAKITNAIREIDSSREALIPTRPFLPYNDIALAKDVTCPSLVWNCRQLQTLSVHIEIGGGSYNLEVMQETGSYRNPRSFLDKVHSLHVHDNSSITAIPPMSRGDCDTLEWCHVERCPKLHSLYSSRVGYSSFRCMRTFSASDLPAAYCIWGKGGISIRDSTDFFQQLQHIYLYNCPRLVFVLPISFTLPNLETLQIAYCSNLQHIFPLDDECPPAIASGVTFENLKHIKLYHLHKLEQICEARLTAPALQTIGIRDCWALRRLPAVARQGPKPEVDCEKDLWNKLEWDGLDDGHHPSLFGTRHSAYYKKTLPRVSFLR